MKLSERKRKILQIVVDDYINTAQPVSSKSITDKYMNDVSSATVRSELAQLEELGYLVQLHTSSGRVPAPDAYKLYVSELMQKGKLTAKEISFIKSTFETHAENIEEVVKNTVKVISELTDYTSVGCTAHNKEDKIVSVNIFRYKANLALLLIVTESTLIKDRYITVKEEVTDEEIESATRLMNKMFAGKDFGEIIDNSEAINSEFRGLHEIFNSVIGAIEDYVRNADYDVVLEGEDKILNHPEYTDSNKVKNFLSVVSNKEKLASLLAGNDEGIELNIKIGNEEGKNIPKDCSLVTATYSVGGMNLGTYGVIGPLRMDYQKVVSVLEGIGKVMEEIIGHRSE